MSAYDSTRRFPLDPDPDRAVAQTIGAMWALVDASDETQRVHRVATIIAASCPQKDFAAQLRAVFWWLKERVRFKRDTFGLEHVRDPDQLLFEIERHGITAADCDDMSTLGAAIVRALGFQPLLITTARRPGPFEHVFFGAVLNGWDIPLDPQERPLPGIWPNPVDRLTVWPYPVGVRKSITHRPPRRT